MLSQVIKGAFPSAFPSLATYESKVACNAPVHGSAAENLDPCPLLVFSYSMQLLFTPLVETPTLQYPGGISVHMADFFIFGKDLLLGHKCISSQSPAKS